MQIIYTPKAKKDLDFWAISGNKVVIKKILSLTKSILETPYAGIGKPEALKYELSGKWSRRITYVDRFVYEIKDNSLIVHSLMGHYN